MILHKKEKEKKEEDKGKWCNKWEFKTAIKHSRKKKEKEKKKKERNKEKTMNLNQPTINSKYSVTEWDKSRTPDIIFAKLPEGGDNK